MKTWIAAILCITFPIVASASDGSYKITYDGGWVQHGVPGVEAKLSIDGDQIRLAQKGRELLSIPAASVTGIGYGQNVHRKIGAPEQAALVNVMVDTYMAVRKFKRDYIGLTWTEGKKKRALSLRCNKDDCNDVLERLVEVTGKHAVDWDAPAEK